MTKTYLVGVQGKDAEIVEVHVVGDDFDYEVSEDETIARVSIKKDGDTVALFDGNTFVYVKEQG